jgi:antitoxin (DNA-binding transcriptional repressor) of toxin-antitoxin stability system
MHHINTDTNVSLATLVELLSTGEEILIEKKGEPVAKISKYEGANSSMKKVGAFKGRVPPLDKLPEWDEDMQGYLGMKD